MALVNEHYLKLPGNYLFSDIAKKINTFKVTHPGKRLIRLGIGDVTRPLPQACITASIRPWTKCPRLKHSMDTDQSKATIF